MDITLQRKILQENGLEKPVLILILMDITLQRPCNNNKVPRLDSFNPYFNGYYTSTGISLQSRMNSVYCLSHGRV